MAPALAQLREDSMARRITVIDVCDSEYTGAGDRLGEHDYEALLAAHAPLAHWKARPTSGTPSP
jgi:fatty-acyl-CoA synthase